MGHNNKVSAIKHRDIPLEEFARKLGNCSVFYVSKKKPIKYKPPNKEIVIGEKVYRVLKPIAEEINRLRSLSEF